MKDATSITIDNDIVDVTGRTSVEISPEETTKYTLTASNNVGQVTKTYEVKVKKAIRIIMVGEPETLYMQWPDEPTPTFHGYKGTVKNIGNKKCPKERWDFRVKMYDKNGLILSDMVMDYGGYSGFQKWWSVLQGQTVNWEWSWYWRSVWEFKCPPKAALVDVSKTEFQLRFPNWQEFE